MAEVTLPERGQPIDLAYLYELAEQINTLTDSVALRSATSSQVNGVSTLASNVKFFAETRVLNKKEVSTGDTESFTVSFANNFKFEPVVTATVFNRDGSNIGNNVSVVIDKINTSTVQGTVRFNEAGNLDVAVNIIAVGIAS